MFVSRSMTRNVITTHPDIGIFDARETMVEKKIRHLPVVDAENRLVGIVTDRDIRLALPLDVYRGSATEEEQAKYAGLKVGEFMTRELVTVSPLDTIQDALLLIQKSGVGAFPVVDDEGLLRGIISVKDLLRAFINVLGIGEPGALLCILVKDKIGQMKRIVDAITEENVSMGSILVARYWEKGMRAVFPYLLTNNPAPVKQKLEKLGFTILDPMQWYIDQLPTNDQ